MISLLRFLFFIGLIAGAAYGAIFVLAEIIEPPGEEYVVPIPEQKFQNQ